MASDNVKYTGYFPFNQDLYHDIFSQLLNYENAMISLFKHHTSVLNVIDFHCRKYNAAYYWRYADFKVLVDEMSRWTQ